jgi:NTE family protein
MVRLRRVLLAVGALLLFSVQVEPRTTVGLALGGGSARGFAHIGFLKWLEENRVPVDYIVGTSMGGLVAGAYASGMSAEEIATLIDEAEWDVMFLADSPFKYKTFRRKEDARRFPAQIDIGLKGGIRLPSGLNPGQQVQLVLDRIGASYPDLKTFDDLPTPFRAVAADLGGSGMVVLDSGSLAMALRATIAIPGVFTPAEIDGKRLVDGGTLNNVPADVARGLGADFVVAVNVSSTTDGPPPVPRSFFDVLGQTMDVMMAAGTKRALASADLVVAPDLRGLDGFDWERRAQLIERGYDAADSARDALLPHALDAESYERWREERARRRVPQEGEIADVAVEGLAPVDAERVASKLRSRFAGRPFARAEVERQIQLLGGTDRYAVIRYALERGPESSGRTRLVVLVTEKENGPPFLLPALDLANIDSNTFAMDLRGRFVFYDALVPGSELRADFAVGTRQTTAAELYQRIGPSPLFLAPRIYWNRVGVNGFDEEGNFVAEYRETTTGAGVDVGLDLGPRSELRLGYDASDVETVVRVGEPFLPRASGPSRFASIRWTLDTQTSPVIPTRGVYVRVRLFHYFDSPDLVLGEEVAPPLPDLEQFEARVSYFRRWRSRHRVFLGGAAGSSFGDDAGYNRYRLGGLLRLGAFHNGEIRGSSYLLGVGGILYQVMKLPAVVGGQGYLGAWLEAGSAFERWSEAEAQWNASGGFVLETFLGPFFIGGSVSLTDGDHRFYVSLAPFLR